MTTNNSNHSAHYASTAFGDGGFKGWAAKQAGDKPGETELSVAHGLGLRPGKQAFAVACALRPVGVSGSQIVMICGAPQLNRMRGLIAAGVVKRDNTAPRNPQGQSVYKLTLTPKGEAAIKRASDKQAAVALTGDVAKPIKGKVKKATKARKPKAPKVTVNQPGDVAPQAPVNEPVSTEQPQV